MSFKHYNKWNSFGDEDAEEEEAEKVASQTPASEEDKAYGNAKEALVSQDVDSLAEALKALPSEQIRAAVAACKDQGNAAFKAKDYERAIEMYTNAIAGDPNDAKLFSNRSACNLALGNAKKAFEDADRCVVLDKEWPKGYYRAGRALLLLGKKHSGQAEKCFVEGLKRDPSNKEMKVWLQKALGVKEEAMADVRAHEAKLKQQQRVSNDYSRFDDIPDPEPPQQEQKQGEDDWQVDEDEYKRVLEEVGMGQTEQFKPTFQRAAVLKGASQQRDAPAMTALAKYLEMAGELHTPRRVVDSLMGVGQGGVLRAYRAAVMAAVSAQPKDPPTAPRWLVLGVGTGLSTLVASKQLGIGAPGSEAKLTVVTARKGPYQARAMARLLKCNGLKMTMSMDSGDEAAAATAAAAATTAAATAAAEEGGEDGDEGGSVTVVHRTATSIRASHLGFGGARASVLVLGQDLMDEALLGLRLLPCARHARLHLADLPKPAAVVPAAARLMAAAVQLITPAKICGSATHHLDRYRWSPSYFSVCADADSEGDQGDGFRFLSAPVEVFGFDFSRSFEGPRPDLPALEKEMDSKGFLPLRGSAALEFEMQRDGVFNGVVFWSEFAFENDKSAFTASRGPTAATIGGSGGGGGGSQQAMQYLEWPKQVRAGEGVQVKATHTTSHVHFALSGAVEGAMEEAMADVSSVKGGGNKSKGTGKHRVFSHLLQNWQLQQIVNCTRNQAYESALHGAITGAGGVLERGRARWKDAPDDGNSGGEGGLKSVVANVLHVNCGCALFAMLSARIGAGEVAVLGCDGSGHLLETAAAMIKHQDQEHHKEQQQKKGDSKEGEESAVNVGPLESRISLAVKDIRQLKMGESLALPFDCAVFEGVDCTLLGEGILHLAHHAWKHMLCEDAVVVPSKAQLYVMAIELLVTDGDSTDQESRFDTDLDLSAWKSYCFHSEPYGVHLHTLNHVQLTEPTAVPSGAFDFTRAGFDLTADKPMPPAPVRFELQVVKAGKCNALVFWHDLTMGVAADGSEVHLSSAPVFHYGSRTGNDSASAHTMQQAMQLVDEVCLSEGEAIPLIFAPTTTQPRFGFDREGFEKLSGKADTPQAADGASVGEAESADGIQAKASDALSTRRTDVPLYDPAWMLQSRQLQQQGAQIAEMCSSNPEGFKQAADAACTLAVDPCKPARSSTAAMAEGAADSEIHLDPAKTLLFASSFFN
jgi:tetratricopeptide (TPR) repeat protein